MPDDIITATENSVAQERSAMDRLTGTTAGDRKAMLADAKETLSEAVSTAIGAVKDNPKTAAAIAAGATAAVAGAAYGATKLGKSKTTKPRTAAKRPAARKPAK